MGQRVVNQRKEVKQEPAAKRNVGSIGSKCRDRWEVHCLVWARQMQKNLKKNRNGSVTMWKETRISLGGKMECCEKLQMKSGILTAT